MIKLTIKPTVDLQVGSEKDVKWIAEQHSGLLFSYEHTSRDVTNKWVFTIFENRIIGCNYH